MRAKLGTAATLMVAGTLAASALALTGLVPGMHLAPPAVHAASDGVHVVSGSFQGSGGLDYSAGDRHAVAPQRPMQPVSRVVVDVSP